MAHEKQKGRPELAPSEATYQFTYAPSIFLTKTPEIKGPGPSLKRLRTVQAMLAMRGYELVRTVRADDARVSYVVTRAGDARHFTHWHDVEGFLSSLGGRT